MNTTIEKMVESAIHHNLLSDECELRIIKYLTEVKYKFIRPSKYAAANGKRRSTVGEQKRSGKLKSVYIADQPFIIQKK